MLTWEFVFGSLAHPQIDSKTNLARPCPAGKPLMAHQGFRMELKFLASPVNLFRTSHGANQETKIDFFCSAPRALCDGPARSCPSLRAPSLQVVPWGPPGLLMARACLALGLSVLNPAETHTTQLSCHHSLEAIPVAPDGNARRVACAVGLIVGSPISPAWPKAPRDCGHETRTRISQDHGVVRAPWSLIERGAVCRRKDHVCV